MITVMIVIIHFILKPPVGRMREVSRVMCDGSKELIEIERLSGAIVTGTVPDALRGFG